MRSKRAKLLVGCLAIAMIGAGSIWMISIRNAALRTLEHERTRDNEVIPFERIELRPYGGSDVKLIQNAAAVRGLAVFRDSYFGATGGGLVKLSSDGKALRRYTVLDGLPESDLTAVAVYHDTLFIGTRSKGLVTFDGEHFVAYRWTDRRPQAITSMVAS